MWKVHIRGLQPCQEYSTDEVVRHIEKLIATHPIHTRDRNVIVKGSVKRLAKSRLWSVPDKKTTNQTIYLKITLDNIDGDYYLGLCFYDNTGSSIETFHKVRLSKYRRIIDTDKTWLAIPKLQKGVKSSHIRGTGILYTMKTEDTPLTRTVTAGAKKHHIVTVNNTNTSNLSLLLEAKKKYVSRI